jgi:hypothetical protein
VNKESTEVNKNPWNSFAALKTLSLNSQESDLRILGLVKSPFLDLGQKVWGFQCHENFAIIDLLFIRIIGNS